MMRRKTAAEYLDMTEAAFVREVSTGRFPPPVLLGKVEHWNRDAIDAAIAMMTGANTPTWEKDFWSSGKAA